jgi:hypothetical protein
MLQTCHCIDFQISTALKKVFYHSEYSYWKTNHSINRRSASLRLNILKKVSSKLQMILLGFQSPIHSALRKSEKFIKLFKRIHISQEKNEQQFEKTFILPLCHIFRQRFWNMMMDDWMMKHTFLDDETYIVVLKWKARQKDSVHEKITMNTSLNCVSYKNVTYSWAAILCCNAKNA